MNQRLLLFIKRLYGKSPSIIKTVVEKFRFIQNQKRAFNTFLSKDEKKDRMLVSSLRHDIESCQKKYLTTPQEYFLFGFRENVSDEYRSGFLSDQMRNKILIDKIGIDIFLQELRNKFTFYKLTAPFFKRGVFLFTHRDCSYDDFCSFCIKQKNLFLKRNSSSKGRGIITAVVNNAEDARILYSRLLKDGDDWIIEERICQSAEMAEWNESSVNTVRVPSILKDGKFNVVGPFFRTGRNGAVVDNAGAGGIFACVDKDTGILTTDGVDERGRYYVKHPNSNKVYKGWQVPRWKELLSLTEQVHRSLPQHIYVGWDFALSDKGWVLVEGNWGQFVSQYNDHIGLKEKFSSLMGVL